MGPETHEAPERIAGHATPEGTRAYFDEARRRGVEFADDAARPLGRTGLLVSKFGYGTYRVHAEVEEHVRTLLFALLHGCNLVDTATNYTNGGSERLVGNVLRALLESGAIQREHVVLVTKTGYVQGSDYEHAMERDAAGDPYPEMVKYRNGLWHCIHPTWLETQLDRSLERMGIERVDVLLLHNPELFFANAKPYRETTSLADLRAVFYERVLEAFEQLERFVEEGRISYYGVASNSFAAFEDEWERISLPELVECARRAADRVHGDAEAHHFAVIGLPLNLYESEAYAQTTESGGRTVLDLAASEGIGVLVHRPLNASGESGIVRLAQYEFNENADEPLNAIAALASSERDLVLALRAWRLWGELKSAAPTKLFFDVGETMKGLFPDLNGRELWLQVLEHFLAPSLVAYLRYADEAIPEEHREEWDTLRTAYQEAFQNFVVSLTSHFNRYETEQKAPLRDALLEELRDAGPSMTLSQIALNAAASVPGVSSVLCGMKRDAYVAECVRLLGVPRLEEPNAPFRAAARVPLLH